MKHTKKMARIVWLMILYVILCENSFVIMKMDFICVFHTQYVQYRRWYDVECYVCIENVVLTSSSRADVAVGSADNFSVAPSTQVSSAAKLVCNLVIIPMAFSQPTNLYVNTWTTKKSNEHHMFGCTNEYRTVNQRTVNNKNVLTY